MEIEALRSRLDEINRITTAEWMDRLTPRGKTELEFHDKTREPAAEQTSRQRDTYEKFYGNKKYYSATARSVAYQRAWVERMAPGNVVLDYACGNGTMALAAAGVGAKLAIGLDISDVSVRNARAASESKGLTNTYFVQANAENTMLPDESIDIALCSGMLHHLDLSYAFPELRRILKVGGRVFAVEALDLNPAIKLYRMLTPDMRTEWEKGHILGPADLRFARRFFDIGEVKYWHPLGYIGGKFPAILPMLDRTDRVLEKIPLVQLMAWIWTFELIRPEKA